MSIKMSFRDLDCIKEEEDRMEMLNNLTIDTVQQILGLDYHNLKELQKYMNDLVEKVEKEKKQNELKRKVILEK
tara:strand:- start:39 stop:260 length:222 start_codon:yes stop_codon:yes gene_type:complete